MNSFFKSRAFIVLLTLLVILAGVPTILTAMGQGSYVRDVAMAVVSPLMRGASAVANGIGGFGEYFTEFDRLKEENRLLSEKVRELEDKIYAAELLEKENEWLRSYLGAKRQNTEYSYLDANLIGSETGDFVSTFTLDKGSAAGVREGMAVVTADGVCGKITEVGLTFSRVSTIINYDSSIGAYVERSGEVGLVSGDFELRREGCCVLEYLGFGADVAVGDKVFSSGLGSVYPRGLYVGEVVEVGADAYNHTKIAVVKPAADLENLTKVMIITSYTVD